MFIIILFFLQFEHSMIRNILWEDDRKLLQESNLTE